MKWRFFNQDKYLPNWIKSIFFLWESTGASSISDLTSVSFLVSMSWYVVSLQGASSPYQLWHKLYDTVASTAMGATAALLGTGTPNHFIQIPLL
jgi:hypothetical protein